jgi:diacylglycerol kinase (CTP)
MELHLARKLWHASTGLCMALLYSLFLTQTQSVGFLSLILVFALVIEWRRLRDARFNRLAMTIWGPLMRHEERNRVTGVPFYVGAALLCVVVFPKPIALMSILYLAVGDPIASVFGILYGQHTPRFSGGKSLVGCMAASVACAIITLLVLDHLPISHGTWIGLAVWGGILGGGAELLPLEVDDNFAIPLVSGFGHWIAFLILGLA